MKRSVVISENHSNLPDDLRQSMVSYVVAPRNPVLIKEPENENFEKIKPSQYISSMSLDTNDRFNTNRHMKVPQIVELLELGDKSYQKTCRVDLDQTIFQPYPSDFVFQNFKPFQTYELPLELRNKDAVPRLVRVKAEDSPYFKVIAPPDHAKKVAPGMASTYKLRFIPDAVKDYFHEIIVTSEREKFIIPIKCIGARGVVDFPDVIDVGDSPVKMSREKTLLLRNIGTDTARFTVGFSSAAFSASPSSGELEPGQLMQMTVEFSPLFAMKYEAEMRISYDTGEEIFSDLQGNGISIDARLSHKSISIMPTYIEMANFQIFKIMNNSSETVKYFFSSYALKEDEDIAKTATLESIQAEEDKERKRFLEEQSANPELADKISILTKSFQNQRDLISTDPMVLEEAELEISPVEGIILPGKEMEVHVVFKPDRIGQYKKTVFCDIQGRENRIPLTIEARGIGPQLRLSYDSVNLGKIFVGSKHTYEIVMKNRGEIEGIFSIREKKSEIRNQFSFDPTEGIVMKDGYQLINLSIDAQLLGSFEEEFKFEIDGTNTELSLKVSGEVIAPSMSFELEKLNLGLISTSFEKSTTISLKNISLVPVNFVIKSTAREISFDINEGFLEAEESVELELVYNGDEQKAFEGSVYVDIPNIAERVAVLPIKAQVQSPPVQLTESILDIGCLFLGHEYHASLTLQNDHARLSARYRLLPPVDASLKVESFYPEGCVDPDSNFVVPITVTPSKLGAFNNTVGLKMAGIDEPLMTTITGTVAGPVLIPIETKVDLGNVKVLVPQKNPHKITLQNESPIPAKISVSMRKDQNIWKLEYPEIVEPESHAEILINAVLDDTLDFRDEMVIDVEHANQIIIPVRAKGIGTTIVARPALGGPKAGLDLGCQFATREFGKEITFTNFGRRHHALTWFVAGYERLSQRDINERRAYEERKRSKDVKFKSAPDLPPPPQSIFELSKMDFELEPGQSIKVKLLGLSPEPGTVRETLQCHAVIGRKKGRERIFSIPIHCQFIEPVLLISQKKLEFRFDKDTKDELQDVEGSTEITNSGDVDLRFDLKTVSPFYVGKVGEKCVSHILSPGQTVEVNVVFHTGFQKHYRSSQTISQLLIDYKDHPSKDVVELVGELNFPNIEFNHADINFGPIRNGTEKAAVVTMSNKSPMTTEYRWWFEIDDELGVFSNRKEQQDALVRSASGLGTSAPSREATNTDGTEPELADLARDLPGIDDVFDIRPIFGKLEPGEQIQTTILFNGHQDINALCRAVCEVDGGPQYELNIAGASADVRYSVSSETIKFGKVMFDSLAERQFTLKNTSLVPFDFSLLGGIKDLSAINHDEFFISPTHGHLGSFEEAKITIIYLPGFPHNFEKAFSLIVADFLPAEMKITGNAVFPRISLDLPRKGGDEDLSAIIDHIRGDMEKERPDISEREIELEAERLIISAKAQDMPAHELMIYQKRPPFYLADYELDLGPVILGDVRKALIRIDNFGDMPVAFAPDVRELDNFGFFCEVSRIGKMEPGHTVSVEITFDPRSVDLPVGQVGPVCVPIQIERGPVVNLHIKALVTMPRLLATLDKQNTPEPRINVAFGEVECGRVKVVTVQLYNELQVESSWKWQKYKDKRFFIDPRLPLHQKKALKEAQKPLPRIFQVFPEEGILAPGERSTVQVEFMPTEESTFEENLLIFVDNSTQRMEFNVSGSGVCPSLIFSKSPIELGPIMPDSAGATETFSIKNNSKVEVEFYSLDFDEKYLKEEEMIRNLAEKNFNAFQNVRMPTRRPGQSLPFIEYIKEETPPSVSEDDELIKTEPKDPLELALEKHSGIDNSPEGLAARNRLGFSGIIWGAPFSGKSTLAKQMSEKYDTVVVTIDEILASAVQSPKSAASKTAREKCEEESRRLEQERMNALESEDTTKEAPALRDDASVMTMRTGVTQNTSKPSRRGGKVKNIPEEPKVQSLLPQKNIERLESELTDAAEANRPLVSTVLPVDLAAEIISEKLQEKEFYKGVIFDGIESSFLTKLKDSMEVLLKALNNRKHLRVFHLPLTMADYLERVKKAKRKAEEEEAERVRKEMEMIRDMTEDEYDALPEEEQKRIDNIRLAKKKERIAEEKRIAEKKREEAERLAELQAESAKKKGKGSKLHLNKSDSTKSSGRVTDDQPGLSRASSSMGENSTAPPPTRDRVLSRAESVASSLHLGRRKGRKISEQTDLPEQSPAEKLIALRFFNAAETQLEPSDKVEWILKYWNMVEQDVISQVKQTQEDESPKKVKSRLKPEEIKAEEERIAAEIENELKKEEVGVIMIEIEAECEPPSLEKIYEQLPTVEEVDDDLGLGVNGPPIPEPIEFTVVPKPQRRQPPYYDKPKFFDLIALNQDDPNIHSDDRIQESLTESVMTEASDKPSSSSKKNRGKGRGSSNASRAKTDRPTPSPLPEAETQPEDKFYRLQDYRWVLQPGEEVTLRVKFDCNKVGTIDRELSFETVSTRQVFKIAVRGVCVFPDIVRDIKKIFMPPKSVESSDGIVRPVGTLVEKKKKTIVKFEPALIGKMESKEKDSGAAKFKIVNSGPLESEVTFAMKKGDSVFTLEPFNMNLAPFEKKILTINAFPKSSGTHDDALIVCVSDNPVPAIFPVQVTGVRPEVQISWNGEGKPINFGKVLLHRLSSQILHLFNPTDLPINWRIEGLDNLGDEFSRNCDSGTINPKETFDFILDFRALKAQNHKRNIRLVVSDTDNIIGDCQSETIPVFAEAYDVAMDMSFPKGCDGGLEFGTIKVHDEMKQVCTLKNRGRYEISFKFTLEDHLFNSELSRFFKIMPQQGSLLPNDRPMQVNIVFNPPEEFHLANLPIIKCHVIEAVIGETIAAIPIKVSARSVFSQYVITPSKDVNFGPVPYGNHKRSFEIENHGEFDFKFAISKLVKPGSPPKSERPKRTKDSRQSSAQSRRPGQLTREQTQVMKLAHGPFIISPGYGNVPVGGSIVINVDCNVEASKKFEEFIAIEIADRDVRKSPAGINYKLIAEGCQPVIDTKNIEAIFEEHRILHSIEEAIHLPLFDLQCGIYGQMESQFNFPFSTVGVPNSVRFKILNPSKLPCDFVASVKPLIPKDRQRVSDSFEFDPPRGQITPHGSVFVTVTVKPKAIGEYCALFEAAVEGAPKAKPLVFTMKAEAYLPRVELVHPAANPTDGMRRLNFRNAMIGEMTSTNIQLRNTGRLPARARLAISDSPAFKIMDKEEIINERTDVCLNQGETKILEVFFCPADIGNFEAELAMKIINNDFEISEALLFGECIQPDVMLTNLPSLPTNLLGKYSQAALDFGGIAINETQRKSFTISNNLNSAVRFEWDEHHAISFEPSVGHIPAKSTIDILVALQSSETIELDGDVVECTILPIIYEEESSTVQWDDRLKIIKWIDGKNASGGRTKEKVIETEEEPKYETNGDARALPIYVSGIVDYSRPELEIEEVNFSQVELFNQTRKEITLKNTGSTIVDFTFDLVDRNTGESLRPSTASRSHIHTAVPFNMRDPVFSLHPDSGRLKEGESMQISVFFNPTEKKDYDMTAFCRVPNMENSGALTMALSGSGFTPGVQFMLPEVHSPHFNKHKVSLERINEEQLLVKLEPVGLGKKYITSIWILNSTGDDLPWSLTKRIGNNTDADESLVCNTPSGSLLSGRKQILKFEYSSKISKKSIETWIFKAGHIEQVISVQAMPREPVLIVDTTHISFPDLIANHTQKKSFKIVNPDPTPVKFKINDDPKATQAAGWDLQLSEKSGIIQPKESIEVEVSVRTKFPGELAHPLNILVDGKISPLSVYVKAFAHEMSVNISSHEENGMSVMFNPKVKNPINFGVVEVNTKVMRTLKISNQSEHAVAIDINLPKKFRRQVQLAFQNDLVIPPLETVEGILTYSPTRPGSTLDGCDLKIQVQFGETFNIAVRGSARCPPVLFNPSQLDFGSRFIYEPGMPTYKTQIQISNPSDQQISLDLAKSEASSWIEVDFKPIVLEPKKSTNVFVSFKPKAAQEFSEEIVFIVNGASEFKLPVTGTGVNLSIGLKTKLKDSELKLGARQLGAIARKKLTIVNRSVVPVDFHLQMNSKEEVLQDSRTFYLTGFIPGEAIHLEPRKTREIEVVFAPKTRIQQFKTDIILEAYGQLKKLVTVSGSCVARSMELDLDAIPFGPIIQGSTSEKRVMIKNTGDIGASFKWDTAALGKYFTISPAKGYLSPGTQQPLVVVFAPKNVSRDVRAERVRCEIEGLSQPLQLTLTGSSLPPTLTKDAPIIFNATVRTSDTKSITLKNPTNQRWSVRVQLRGAYAHFWQPESDLLIIEPQLQRSMNFTYTPMEMTSSSHKHEANLFFQLPDGQGQAYVFQGISEPPKLINLPQRDIPAKCAYEEKIRVENWLKKTQRLAVEIEPIKPEKFDASLVVDGKNHIDLGSLETRAYTLRVSSFKEGLVSAKVTFRNPSTGEFIAYQVNFKFTQPKPQSETIKLSSQVRQLVSHTVSIPNPLPKEVVFTWDSKLADIIVPPTFHVPPLSTGSCTFDYQPLKTGQTEGTITCFTPELGAFHFPLLLTAKLADPEPVVSFSAPLGSSQTKTIRIRSYTRQKTDFIIKCSSPQFMHEKSVSAPQSPPNGTEITFEVTFEPTQIGRQNCYITLNSNAGGEYEIPLVSECTVPQPLGPFSLRAKTQIPISFKNVFAESVEFHFATANGLFTVNKKKETIKSKKSFSLLVGFEGSPTDEIVTSKLIITRKDMPGIAWEMYLRGSNEKI
ncbi:Oidioi.mRNA.OKI2018_I69.PAR.g10844.t1.cds [Oikopleura dioica]|uniref:Oidioi.mRNA.OKI2018_I69.PAR.g10844.t1.cds n=1 Tax=Oikopleura dioica TaxID=34765 RepID=A0ABN7RW92_OIKDI|nr:Oidioi.mRNA.OKI2018_I69.PAR.g10844.t1.cds [Oikopleura dioica]